MRLNSQRVALFSNIKEHPKNPRKIDESTKKKLKQKMSEVGLIQPLIVNKRSGYLLGGHQRMAVMDSLEKYKEGKNDYQIDVALVDLDEKSELEMLVFLNNPSAQGVWDTDLLAEIKLDMGIDFIDMGFNAMDIEFMFDGDDRMTEGMFAESQEVKETKDTLNEIKEVRKQSARKMEDLNDADYYFVVVCKDRSEKERILKKLKVPVYEKFIAQEKIDFVVN